MKNLVNIFKRCIFVKTHNLHMIMLHNKDSIYNLKVTGTMVVGDQHYYLVEECGMKYRVKMLPFQQKQPLPKEIKCIVHDYDADNSPLFIQHKGDISRSLYTIGNTYPFVVHKKLSSMSGHCSNYYGSDTNGLRAFIQAPVDKQLTLGRNIRCTVKHIDSEGNLSVALADYDMDTETNFLTYAQLMRNVSAETLPVDIQLDTLRAEPDKNKKLVQMLAQYDSHAGEWVLSYLTVLNNKREAAIEAGDLDMVCSLTYHRRRILEWMMEDSRFLTFYSSEIAHSLREKGEREIAVGEALLKGVELIRKGEVDVFLQKLFNKVRMSGYLTERQQKIDLLVALFRMDHSLIEKNMFVLAEVCHYVVSDSTDSDDPVLETVIELVRWTVERADMNDNLSPTVMMQLIAILLLLCRNKEVSTLSVWRSMLYRYSCQISPLSTRILIDKAFEVLMYVGKLYRPEFTWDDILQFKPESFVAKLRSFVSNAAVDEEKLVAQHITGNGGILLRDNSFVFYAGCLPNALTERQKLSEWMSLIDGRVCVVIKKELKPKSSESQNLFMLKKCWDELCVQLSQGVPLQKKIVIKTLPSVNTRVTITLRPFNARFPLLMFADITDPCYEGSGVLMANEVCRYHIRSLGSVFYEGDTFEATVVKTEENGRLAFSIQQELFDMVIRKIRPGKQVCAKLIRISKSTGIWVSEEGYTLFTPLGNSHPMIGTTALLEVTDINDSGYINAAYVDNVEELIDEENALSRLVSEYISYCHPQDEELDESDNELGQTLTDEDVVRLGQQLSPAVIRELPRLLLMAVTVEPALSIRYNLLGAARLLSGLTDDARLTEYLSLRMNYEENIYSFAMHTGQVRWTGFSRIDDDVIARFPSLRSLKSLLDILAYFYNRPFEPSLVTSIATTKDENKEHIISLVMANSLLYRTLSAENLRPLRDELLQRIGAGELVQPYVRTDQEKGNNQDEDIPLLGRESGEVEFKSSIVYPAGKTVPDMKQQGDVILRAINGFLNASGGTLFIDVADSGKVTGLKNDYTYMVCDSDAYERFIRQRIVSTMGKDVNGIINIDFPRYADREVCRIQVPCYGKLIELNGVVWQRQGNSTMLLDGNALLKQQQRKKETLKAELESITQTIASKKATEELVSGSLQATGGVQTAFAAAFAASLEQKKKKDRKSVASKKVMISTSLIRPNLLHPKERGEIEIEAYLSLLDNNGYILTDEIPHWDNELLTLAIGVHEKEGNLLLCYDNGYVNRVALRLLLQKKRGYAYKNGANREGRLIFATIENGEPDILVRTRRQGSEHLKMFPMNKVKKNTDLTLKGTPVFSYDFGEVTGWELIPMQEAEKLRKLENDNPHHQGSLLTSDAIAAERELLKVLGW